jgi:hypothetical protein
MNDGERGGLAGGWPRSKAISLRRAGKAWAVGDHRRQIGFCLSRDDGECIFSGWMLMKNQKGFLKSPIEKFPFHEIPEAISRKVFYQGLF